MNKKDIKVCSYCYSKFAIHLANIILVPYDYILSDAIKTYVGINTKNSIIVWDEAHNIDDKTEDIYSEMINIKDLDETLSFLYRNIKVTK